MALWLGRRTYNHRSQVRVSAAPLHVTTLGKLFTYMCLCSPSSISWYRPMQSWTLVGSIRGSGRVQCQKCLINMHWELVLEEHILHAVWSLIRLMSVGDSLSALKRVHKLGFCIFNSDWNDVCFLLVCIFARLNIKPIVFLIPRYSIFGNWKSCNNGSGCVGSKVSC